MEATEEHIQEKLRELAEKEYGKDIEIKKAEGNEIKFYTQDKIITLTYHAEDSGENYEKEERWRRGHKPAKDENEDSFNGGMHQLTFNDILGISGTANGQNDSRNDQKNDESKKESENISAKASDNSVEATVEKTVDTEKKGTEENRDIVSVNDTAGEPVKKKRHRRTKAEMEAARAAEKEADNEKKEVKGNNIEKTEENALLNEEKKAEDDETEETEHIVFKHETPCPFKRGDSVESRYTKKAYTVLSTQGNTVRVILTDEKEGWSECTMCASDLKESKKAARALVAE